MFAFLEIPVNNLYSAKQYFASFVRMLVNIKHLEKMQDNMLAFEQSPDFFPHKSISKGERPCVFESMIKYNPVTKESGKCFATGRAAIAIELALRSVNTIGGYVIVPANICYAAVLPIIYAGFKPLFCDVDRFSGNVSLNAIREVKNDTVVAAILPHMYGNPIFNFPVIVDYLHSFGITVIEDCASLMATEGDSYIPGTLGDYVVYSTGYSKPIDLNYGGLLFSRNKELDYLEKIEMSFPPFKDEFESEWKTFSAVYRALRNTDQFSLIGTSVYQNLPHSFKDSFQFSITEEQKEKIFECMVHLQEVTNERFKQYNLYKNLIKIPKTKIYEFNSHAVPWRFNMLLDEERKNFIAYCLEKRLPVSDWYPQVTPIFGMNEKKLGAEWHENHIVNFPLLISEDEIVKICGAINEFYD